MARLVVLPLLALISSSGALSLTSYTSDQYPAASGGSSYGSSGYGSYGLSKCDCTQYDLLGVVAGGAALAALGLYLLLQQAAAARALDTWAPPLPEHLGRALQVAVPAEQVASRTVSAVCHVSRLLETGQLNLTSAASARSGYKDEDAECDCFRGIAGALAGFAALAALASFALQQAVAAAAAARALPSGQLGSLPEGASVLYVARFLRAFAENQNTCLPHTLCVINRDAAHIGSTRFFTAVKLASLPVSWFLSSTESSPHTFSEYCDAISDVSESGNCDVIYPQCVSVR